MRTLLVFVLGAAVATLFLTQKRPVRQIRPADESQGDVIERFLANQDGTPTKPTLH